MQYCHPSRSRIRTSAPVDEVYHKNCLEMYDSGSTPHACQCNGRIFHHGTDDMQLRGSDRSDGNVQSEYHSCPAGKILRCTDCAHLRDDEIGRAQAGISCGEACHSGPEADAMVKCEERPCCANKNSWTEPGIYRCSHPDSNDASMCPECGCGAQVASKEPQQQKLNKRQVRFSDEVMVHGDDDCEKIFRSLDESDIKELCPCCKECAVKGTDQCIGRPVLVYELPEPKFEGTSVSQKDYSWKKIPERGIPPWHPNIKDRWYHLKVPSITETIYQSDYKPPFVVRSDREPAYLAPLKEEEIDPCQKLSEKYSSWQKTTAGDGRTHRPPCDTCDKDLHPVHLHECDASQLPPLYQCHGDGPICQPPADRTDGEKFAICEKGDAEGSRYWWQRTCCESKAGDPRQLDDLPGELRRPACPSYTTSYKHDFKDPKKLQSERSFFGNCRACEYCTRPYAEGQPNLLCTKDTRQPFMAQRAGII